MFEDREDEQGDETGAEGEEENLMDDFVASDNEETDTDTDTEVETTPSAKRARRHL